MTDPLHEIVQVGAILRIDPKTVRLLSSPICGCLSPIKADDKVFWRASDVQQSIARVREWDAKPLSQRDYGFSKDQRNESHHSINEVKRGLRQMNAT